MKNQNRFQHVEKNDSLTVAFQNLELAKNDAIYKTLAEIGRRLSWMNTRRKDGLNFSAENISFSPIVYKIGDEELSFKIDIGQNMYHEFDLQNCQFQVNTKLSSEEIQNLQAITMLFMEARELTGSKISSSEHPFEIRNKGEKFLFENAKYSLEMDDKIVKPIKPIDLKPKQKTTNQPTL